MNKTEKEAEKNIILYWSLTFFKAVSILGSTGILIIVFYKLICIILISDFLSLIPEIEIFAIILFSTLLLGIIIVIVIYSGKLLSEYLWLNRINERIKVLEIYLKRYENYQNQINEYYQFKNELLGRLGELENETNQIVNYLFGLRVRIEVWLSKLEKSFKAFQIFVLRQFKNFAPELLSLLQSFSAFLIFDFSNETVNQKKAVQVVSILIIFLSGLNKIPEIPSYIIIILLTLLEALIIALSIIYGGETILISSNFFYICSILIYLGLILLIIQQNKEYKKLQKK